MSTPIDDSENLRQPTVDTGEESIASPDPQSENSSSKTYLFNGLFMVMIAVVWFIGGLYYDYVYIYPMILFIVGIVLVIKSRTK